MVRNDFLESLTAHFARGLAIMRAQMFRTVRISNRIMRILYFLNVEIDTIGGACSKFK